MEVTPVSPYRLPLAGGMDGVLRRRGGVLERLLHHRPDNDADRRMDHRADDHSEPVVVRVAQTAPDAVLFGARSRTSEAARYGIERMRFALGVDDELSAFYKEFAEDPLIGRSVRRRPWLRVRRRPEPFEALAWAICEQLIEYEHAAAIQRRIVRALGQRWVGWDACQTGGDAQRVGWDACQTGGDAQRVGGDACQTGGDAQRVGGDVCRAGWDRGGGLRDVPSPRTLAGVAPARLESFDLSGSRARLLVRVAREVASGRVDLHDADHERAWRGLRAIPGIGPWTIEMLALKGQGRHDQLPAGDLGLLKHVARRLSGGDPRARATEEDVRVFFAPYGRWGGLAAAHVLAL